MYSHTLTAYIQGPYIKRFLNSSGQTSFLWDSLKYIFNYVHTCTYICMSSLLSDTWMFGSFGTHPPSCSMVWTILVRQVVKSVLLTFEEGSGVMRL